MWMGRCRYQGSPTSIRIEASDDRSLNSFMSRLGRRSNPWAKGHPGGEVARDRGFLLDYAGKSAFRRVPGNGIGLAIVPKGIEKLGGHGGLESELGKGS